MYADVHVLSEQTLSFQKQTMTELSKQDEALLFKLPTFIPYHGNQTKKWESPRKMLSLIPFLARGYIHMGQFISNWQKIKQIQSDQWCPSPAPLSRSVFIPHTEAATCVSTEPSSSQLLDTEGKAVSNFWHFECGIVVRFSCFRFDGFGRRMRMMRTLQQSGPWRPSGDWIGLKKSTLRVALESIHQAIGTGLAKGAGRGRENEKWGEKREEKKKGKS